MTAETEPAASATASDKFRTNTFYVIIDSLLRALQQRRDAYESVNRNFGFLYHVKSLKAMELKESATLLLQCFPDDLSDSFPDELLQFVSYIDENDAISPHNLCVQYVRKNFSRHFQMWTLLFGIICAKSQRAALENDHFNDI